MYFRSPCKNKILAINKIKTPKGPDTQRDRSAFAFFRLQRKKVAEFLLPVFACYPTHNGQDKLNG